MSAPAGKPSSPLGPMPFGPSRPPPLLNLALFALTALSVAGASKGFFGDYGSSAAFALTLLPILLCHEMGHYLLGRLHHMVISLPFFIPLPIGFGTLGAVIFIRSRFPDRNALVDVGAAGPLAGAAFAIAVHVYGVVNASTLPVPAGVQDFSSSLLAIASRHLATADAHAVAPAFATFVVRDSLLTRLLVVLLRGDLPAGHDLVLSPALLASSAILIITMLNLFPVGQLDGGHVAFAVFGRRHPAVGRVALFAMVGLGVFFWVGWLMWAALGAMVVRVHHPPVVDEAVPMTPGRRFVALLCLLLLVLTFSPAPLEFVPLP